MPDLARPRVPHYRWLRRLTVVAVVAVMAVAGLRMWTGYRAQSRLDATVAAIRAGGEPLLVEDFAQPSLSAEENSATYLRRALANWPAVPGTTLLITQTPWYYAHSGGTTAPPSADPITDNAAYLASLRPVLDDLRRAEAASGTDWGIALTQPMWNILLPHLGDARKLANLLDDAARRAADEGDGALALEMMRLQFVIARSVDETMPPCIITALVSKSIIFLPTRRVEASLPQLRHEPRTREQAERLLAVLLDEDQYRQRQAAAWVGERAMAYALHTSVMQAPPGKAAAIIAAVTGTPDPLTQMILSERGRLFFEPLLLEDTRSMLEYFSARSDAVGNAQSEADLDLGDWADEQIDARSRTVGGRLRSTLTNELMQAQSAVARTMLRTLAARRLAAAAVAIHLYELDHGRRPATLAELVPRYLPALPRDPYRADGGPLRYRPEGAVLAPAAQHVPTGPMPPLTPLPQPGPALIYSVGADGRDDGGVIFLWDDGSLDHNVKFNVNADHFFLLDAWPPSDQGQ